MKKEIRLQVYNKYDGHCAYCGNKIEYKDMQLTTLYHKEKMVRMILKI